MNIPAALAALVRQRAGGRCEYCGMCQSLQGATFHIEHITPRTCGGVTGAENLALACPGCNLHKSDRSHVPDTETGMPCALYHPRRDVWGFHFRWEGTMLIGLTSTGRATIAALDMNHPRRQRVRQAESVFGLFPPPAREQLDAWRQTSGAGADLSDPDRDGVVNLMEFATDTGPWTANGQPGELVKNGSSLEFTWPRRKAALAEVSYAVEWSESLTGPWSAAGVNTGILSDGSVMQQMRSTLLAGGSGRRFVRLRVTRL